MSVPFPTLAFCIAKQRCEQKHRSSLDHDIRHTVWVHGIDDLINY